MDVREEPSERSRRGGWWREGVVSIPVACGAKPHRHQLHHYHPLKLSPLIILLSLHTNWSSAQVIGQSLPPPTSTRHKPIHYAFPALVWPSAKGQLRIKAQLSGHKLKPNEWGTKRRVRVWMDFSSFQNSRPQRCFQTGVRVWEGLHNLRADTDALRHRNWNWRRSSLALSLLLCGKPESGQSNDSGYSCSFLLYLFDFWLFEHSCFEH